MIYDDFLKLSVLSQAFLQFMKCMFSVKPDHSLECHSKNSKYILNLRFELNEYFAHNHKWLTGKQKYKKSLYVHVCSTYLYSAVQGFSIHLLVDGSDIQHVLLTPWCHNSDQSLIISSSTLHEIYYELIIIKTDLKNNLKWSNDWRTM